MNLAEFKAWFEGFTEAMDGPPSEKAWERIKARVKEIDGRPTTQTIYVDRYVEPYRRWFGFPLYDTTSYAAGPDNKTLGASLFNAKAEGRLQAEIDPGWNSMAAMADAGRAEALSLNA